MHTFIENCQANSIKYSQNKNSETFFKGAKKRRNFLRLFFLIILVQITMPSTVSEVNNNA